MDRPRTPHPSLMKSNVGRKGSFSTVTSSSAGFIALHTNAQRSSHFVGARRGSFASPEGSITTLAPISRRNRSGWLDCGDISSTLKPIWSSPDGHQIDSRPTLAITRRLIV